MAGPGTLSRTARNMRWLSLLAAVALPVAYGLLWTNASWSRSVLQETLPGIGINDVGLAQLTAGFLLGATPTLLMATALFSAGRFFGYYQEGELFPAAGAPELRHFGKLLLAAAIASFVVRTAAGLVFSAHLPAGQKQLIISISSSDIFLVIFGILMMMIGHILAEAARVAAENRQFV